jgi:hypothetical protein
MTLTKIRINGREHILSGMGGGFFPAVTYETLVNMSGKNPEKVFTVTFSTNDRAGSLIKGEKVDVTEGMIFNVMDTSYA